MSGVTEEGVRFILTEARVIIQFINAIAAGIVNKIERKEKGGYEINIADGREVVDIIPPASCFRG